MRVVHVTSEVTPFAKTGGLGDVCAALPAQLHELGVEQRVFVPFYGTIDRRQSYFVPVDFLRNMRVHTGPHDYVCNVYTTRLPGSELWIYLIDCPVLYNRPSLYTEDVDEHLRFAVLSQAALQCCQRMGFAPDIVHCHDWQTALMPLYLKTLFAWDGLFARSRSLLSIHNLAFQGWFGAEAVTDVGLADYASQVYLEDLANGVFSFLKTGILHASAIGTVSPTYAREIQTPEYGEGLDTLLRARHMTFFGILNGIDEEAWNPQTDAFIPHHYSRSDLGPKRDNKHHLLAALGIAGEDDDDTPVLGMVSRLTSQKGQELLFDALPWVLERHRLKVAVLGSGEQRLEEFFASLQSRYPDRVCFYRGYNEELAHLIEAGADMFMMPSRYEPCGLNQMYSLAYGTVPIVRRTGGLADTVRQYDTTTGTGNGILFDYYDAAGVVWALERALSLYHQPEHWRRMIDNGMQEDFSWPSRARDYLQVYELLSRL
jgi:starch synthase